MCIFGRILAIRACFGVMWYNLSMKIKSRLKLKIEHYNDVCYIYAKCIYQNIIVNAIIF